MTDPTLIGKKATARYALAEAIGFAERSSLNAEAHLKRAEAAKALIEQLDGDQYAPVVIQQAINILDILVRSAENVASSAELTYVWARNASIAFSTEAEAVTEDPEDEATETEPALH